MRGLLDIAVRRQQSATVASLERFASEPILNGLDAVWLTADSRMLAGV
jgi:hypothetical protein